MDCFLYNVVVSTELSWIVLLRWAMRPMGLFLLTGVDAGIVYDDCSNREQAVLALYERDRVVNTVIQDAVQL